MPPPGDAAGPGGFPSSHEPIDVKRFQRVVQQVFEAENTGGCFVLYDESQRRFHRHGDERSRQAFIPASTFKIFNSLVALEEGIVADERETRPWDGQKRFVPEWNRDQNLAGAIRYSAVWFYQQLAREIGRDRMQLALDAVGYGNGAIGEAIDTFWLDGSLRITAQQQVEFLRRLHFRELPFSDRTIDIVQRIMTRDAGEDHILRGKTGWAIRVKPDQGWFVGSLDTTDRFVFFAIHVDIQEDGRGRARERMAKDILRGLDLLRDQ